MRDHALQRTPVSGKVVTTNADKENNAFVISRPELGVT